MQDTLRVDVGDWATLGGDAYVIRHEVFVLEQSVPESLERDAFDETSLHAVAYDELGTPVGTGRLLADGHIGRMAVRRIARGQGVGGRRRCRVTLGGAADADAQEGRQVGQSRGAARH